MKKEVHHGDMMSVFTTVDHFLVCTSAIIKNGALVMDNRMGKALADKHPSLPGAIGKWIIENHGEGGKVKAPVYGVKADTKVGIFQNKILTPEFCNLGAVSFSAKQLAALALANPTKTYALEAPNDSDRYFLIENIMKMLPDNVQIWLPK